MFMRMKILRTFLIIGILVSICLSYSFINFENCSYGEDEEFQNFTYVVDGVEYQCTGIEGEEYVSIYSFPEDYTEIVIPAKINGKTVWIDDLVIGNVTKISLDENHINYIYDENCNCLVDPDVTVGKCICKGCNESSIPDDIYAIGHGAFKGCNNLKNIDIPNSVTNIYSNAFEDCSGLSSINLNNCSWTGVEAFKNCIGLQSVEYSLDLDHGWSWIGSNTFEGCTNLTSVILPVNSSINREAFKNCVNLKAVVWLVTNNRGWAKEDAFDGCTSDLTIYGYEDSEAEDYALENDINFVAVDKNADIDEIVDIAGISRISDKNLDDDNEADEKEYSIGVNYRTHVQSYGWQDYVDTGKVSGTVGKAKRLEAIQIKLVDSKGNELDSSMGGIEYSTHVQKYGWMDYVANDEMSGTSGEAKRLEAIKIRLTGDVADEYDVYYRVQAQKFGWLGWAKNDEEAGSAGYGYRLEAIQIKLVEKDGDVPSNGSQNTKNLNAYYDKNEIPILKYRTHVQKYGWQNYVTSGNTSGTEGKAKRLEGIEVYIDENNTGLTGGIKYRSYVQKYGWMDFVRDGEMSGTSGEAKRLEAIRIQLTGELSEEFDVYYRVHAQKFGWMGWAKNGCSAGTNDYAYRLEAIQIQLVYKNTPAPGSTDISFSDNKGKG